LLFSSEAAEYRGRTVLILPQGFRLPYDRSSKFAAGKDTNTEMEEAGTLNKKNGECFSLRPSERIVYTDRDRYRVARFFFVQHAKKGKKHTKYS
jgi:hypothetical protein